jgi:hypothetical protein
MIKYIDQEEKELIESLYSEEWEPNPDKTVNKVYKDYACNSIELTIQKHKILPKAGCMKGTFAIQPDFNEPLEDFEEY